jgi:hypothetical protein
MFPRQQEDITITGSCVFYAVLAGMLQIEQFGRNFRHCAEAGSNTSTVVLRVIGGHDKGIQCLEDINNADLAPQIGGVSNLRQ